MVTFVLIVAVGTAVAGTCYLGVIRPLRQAYVTVVVDGRSMAPTYRGGDRVLVRRGAADRVRRDDVVVIEKPGPDHRWHTAGTACHAPPGDRVWLIKRVVALPGDPVPPGVLPGSLATAGRVGAGLLIVLGDNPDDSYDSRIIGFIPFDRVLGVVQRRR